VRGVGDMDWVRVDYVKMSYSTVQRQVSVTGDCCGSVKE
jgi:hypothetical protein